MIRWIPNALTVLRILLVPVFLYFLLYSPLANRVLIALIIFVVASLTDYFDGMLARKFNVISNFGKIMDPLADKLIVLAALAGLCWLPPFYISKVVFFIILARELIITILREVYQRKGIVVAADKLGKLKTVMQMLGIIAAYCIWGLIPSIPAALVFPFMLMITIWFWLVALITVVSGFNYLKIFAPKGGQIA